MRAVILAGGKGARLRPFTMTIPKPLLPLGDVPIIEVVLRQLALAGVRRVALTLGHMAHLFTAFFGTGERLGIELEYYVEDEPLGTAGSLHLVKNLDEPFLVMNGDLLTTIDYRKLVQDHLASGALGTIAVAKRNVNIDFGVIVGNERGELVEYREKPTIDYAVSMGINVLSPAAIEFIPRQAKFDMPDLMMAMKRAGRLVRCFDSDCYWQDIGRFDDYQQASSDFAASPQRFLPSDP